MWLKGCFREEAVGVEAEVLRADAGDQEDKEVVEATTVLESGAS